jgi:hypothetical protein
VKSEKWGCTELFTLRFSFFTLIDFPEEDAGFIDCLAEVFEGFVEFAGVEAAGDGGDEGD